jgi:hypothetical protein
MDYIISCRTAVCGHSFCEECITESLIRKKECPHCRKDIRKWVLQKSEIVDNAVQILIDSKRENGEEEEAKRLEERIKNHRKWLEKHKVQDIKAGDRIDVLDTEHIWCSAIVELKIKTASKQPLLYVHYEGWSRKYDEYMFVTNRRIAPMGTYTKRNDIPRYKLPSSLQEVRHAHVVESGRAQLNDIPDIRHVIHEEAVRNLEQAN